MDSISTMKRNAGLDTLLKEPFLSKLASEVASLAKGMFEDGGLRKSIEKTVHEAISDPSENLLALSMRVSSTRSLTLKQ